MLTSAELRRWLAKRGCSFAPGGAFGKRLRIEVRDAA
jgi:hypothetical protein